MKANPASVEGVINTDINSVNPPLGAHSNCITIISFTAVVNICRRENNDIFDKRNPYKILPKITPNMPKS